MARTVVRNTSYLSRTTSVPLTGVPLTLVCWGKTTDTTNSQNVLSLCQTTNATNGAFVLNFGGATAGDPIRAYAGSGGVYEVAVSGSGYSSGVWTHAAAVFASTTSRTAYINGVAGTANTVSKTPASISRIDIGQLHTTVQNFGGDIADAAIYNVALDAAEIAALAAGVSPINVRPDALVAYWPLKYEDGDVDHWGQYDLTATGSPTYNPHPPIIYPRGLHVFVPRALRTATPGVATLTTTAFAPTVSTPRLSTPTTQSLTLTTFAPTVTAPRTVVPTTSTLVLTSFTPTVQTPYVASPGTASLSLASFSPTVGLPQLTTPATVGLSLTTFAPTVTATAAIVVTPTTLGLSLTTFAPTVATPQLVVPGVTSLSLTTFSPAISTPQTVTPATTALTLTTFTPTVTATAGIVATPSTASLSLTAFAPTAETPQLVIPGVTALSLTTFLPVIATPQAVTPTTATLSLTTFEAVIAVPQTVTPTTLGLLLTTFSPTVTAASEAVATPETAALTLTTFAPAVSTSQTIIPSTCELLLSSTAPTVVISQVATPATTTLTLSSFAPEIRTPVTVTPGTSALLIVTFDPECVSVPRALSFGEVIGAPGYVVVKGYTGFKGVTSIREPFALFELDGSGVDAMGNATDAIIEDVGSGILGSGAVRTNYANEFGYFMAATSGASFGLWYNVQPGEITGGNLLLYIVISSNLDQFIEFDISSDGSNLYASVVGSSGNSRTLTGVSNGWNYFGFTRTGNTTRIVCNGDFAGTSFTAVPENFANNTLVIPVFAAGSHDQVVFAQVAYTAEEWAYIYNSGVGRLYADWNAPTAALIEPLPQISGTMNYYPTIKGLTTFDSVSGNPNTYPIVTSKG